ncbi:nuclear speckle splicing regulatory protein 1 isoform X2 [Candoia aspera]|uniref:nuclear speckle splicing regulatory protein 1 isoform X2 n=1 Tax=Candoia aspera TaxID=51853 RepID=UPI002FD7EF28
MAAPGKQYGLIFAKKAQQKGLVKHAVFMEDSDEETKMEIQRALAEDSTVYEYDSIFEDIQQKKAESHASLLAGKAEKKPKYIQNILRAAELRKKEQEKRMEKKIQKEREAEGDTFDDKEAFVTSAYKKKLQERAEEEERERKEAAVEACLDVTKQKDLSGFYRHLLNQAVGEEKMPHCSLRGTGFKGENLAEEPPDSSQASRSLGGQARREEDPDADGDSQAGSSAGEDGAAEGVPASRGSEGRAAGAGGRDRGGGRSKPRQSQRDSRSPSEERHPHPRRAEKGDAAGGGKAGQHEEKSRHGRRLQSHGRDARSGTEGHRRRREDREDRPRRKDPEEEEEEEEERQEQRRGRGKRERRARERDRDGDREKGRGRDAAGREGRDEKPTHGRKRSSGSMAQGGPSSPEKSPEVQRKAAADGGEEPAEKPPESLGKFAKRSNQETVLSARDRYLARQMARVGPKSYVETEED